jgi:hypothetical protein
MRYEGIATNSLSPTASCYLMRKVKGVVEATGLHLSGSLSGKTIG